MSSTAVYRAFIKAGVDEDLAALASKDITEPDLAATKADLPEMKVDLIRWMAGFFLANTVLLVTMMGMFFKTVG